MIEITNEIQYDDACQLIEFFINKGQENLTKKEDDEFDKLIVLVEAYEKNHYNL